VIPEQTEPLLAYFRSIWPDILAQTEPLRFASLPPVSNTEPMVNKSISMLQIRKIPLVIFSANQYPFNPANGSTVKIPPYKQ
jgi:hypothetical protein